MGIFICFYGIVFCLKHSNFQTHSCCPYESGRKGRVQSDTCGQRTSKCGLWGPAKFWVPAEFHTCHMNRSKGPLSSSSICFSPENKGKRGVSKLHIN